MDKNKFGASDDLDDLDNPADLDGEIDGADDGLDDLGGVDESGGSDADGFDDFGDDDAMDADDANPVVNLDDADGVTIQLGGEELTIKKGPGSDDDDMDGEEDGDGVDQVDDTDFDFGDEDDAEEGEGEEDEEDAPFGGKKAKPFGESVEDEEITFEEMHQFVESFTKAEGGQTGGLPKANINPRANSAALPYNKSGAKPTENKPVETLDNARKFSKTTAKNGKEIKLGDKGETATGGKTDLPRASIDPLKNAKNIHKPKEDGQGSFEKGGVPLTTKVSESTVPQISKEKFMARSLKMFDECFSTAPSRKV
jgi:hypothetical protein